MRLVGSGAAGPAEVKRAAYLSFGVACLAGFVLAVTTSWWLILIGLGCLAAGWYYTGGRSPYGYRGLGEVMVFVFFGLVAVVGTTYVQTGTLPLAAWFAGTGIGALACAILVANNLRDIPTDRDAGKRTLAVLLGAEQTRYLFTFLVAGAGIALVGVLLETTAWALVALVFLVPALPATRLVLTGTTGRGLVPVLQSIGTAELLYALGLFIPLVLF
jgi:1,4-dihydroxy-2-naphthoate octaprenyltransferase